MVSILWGLTIISFHKFILNMRLLLQFPTVISILSTVNLLLKSVPFHDSKLKFVNTYSSIHLTELRLLLHFIVLCSFVERRYDYFIMSFFSYCHFF